MSNPTDTELFTPVARLRIAEGLRGRFPLNVCEKGFLDANEGWPITDGGIVEIISRIGANLAYILQQQSSSESAKPAA